MTVNSVIYCAMFYKEVQSYKLTVFTPNLINAKSSTNSTNIPRMVSNPLEIKNYVLSIFIFPAFSTLPGMYACMHTHTCVK